MAANALIVEDNEMLVKIYRSIFSALNCSILHARTREDALRWLDNKKPDLIVVDERLADASGIETVRAIRARGHLADIPVIATVSALSERELAEAELRALGVAFVVLKPWQPSSFSTLVQRCLARKSAAAKTVEIKRATIHEAVEKFLSANPLVST